MEKLQIWQSVFADNFTAGFYNLKLQLKQMFFYVSCVEEFGAHSYFLRWKCIILPYLLKCMCVYVVVNTEQFLSDFTQVWYVGLDL